MTLKLIGAGLSPYVRKSLVILLEKGLKFDHEPLVPFGPNPEYRKLHPQGKIPTLTDGDKVVPDSSAIAVYLEKIAPNPPLISQDAYLAARTVWHEEYGDSVVVAAVVPYFAQRILLPLLMKTPGDEAIVEKAARETIPPVFDYLEGQLKDADYLVGNCFSLADIATVSPFVNYRHGGGSIDSARHPRLASYVDRILDRPSFKTCLAQEEVMLAQMKG